MQTEKQTDMTKLILAFRNFANAPNSRDGKINILETTVLWILITHSKV
jgi:hypothetical protein